MRNYYEPLEADDIFGAQEAADIKARQARIKAAQIAFDQKAKAVDEEDRRRILKLTADAGLEQLLREYESAGVMAPSVDDDGNPTCSLSMLLHMGWSIGNISGERVLLRPANR